MKVLTFGEKLYLNWLIGRQHKKAVKRLGSESAGEREHAATYFFVLGETGRSLLYKALNGPLRSACGAAAALDRMEDGGGIRRILRRCYEEEWLTMGGVLNAETNFESLFWLSADSVQREYHRALDTAAIRSELPEILAQLSIALTALRLLNRRESARLDTLQRSILFGNRSLRYLERGQPATLAHNLMQSLRLEAVRGLLLRASDERLLVLADALQSRDLSVVRTAINGLRRGGDRRAAAYLHPLAFGGGHPCSELAREAYARLIGSQAAPLTLLRPSQPETPSEELLRPAAPNANAADKAHLLRSANE